MASGEFLCRTLPASPQPENLHFLNPKDVYNRTTLGFDRTFVSDAPEFHFAEEALLQRVWSVSTPQELLLSNRVFRRLASISLAILASTAAANAAQVALIGDASVSTARPSTNFGALSNLYIGNGNTAFLQFDLSTLPAGTTSSQIARATLTVFVNRVNTAGSVTLSPATSAWSESSVTSSTAPSIGTTTGIFMASAAGQYVTLDVTALVQSWVTTPATNFGFALTSTSANLLLDSKENDETAHPATLDITITSQGATGPQGVPGPQGPIGPAGANGPQGPIGPQGVPGPAGPAGAIGLTGNTGPAGPTGPAGTIGVVTNWSSSTTYQPGQVVFCAACTTNGSSYVALQPNINQDPPTQTSVWNLIAEQGETGPAGVAGPQGPVGLTGPAGPTGNTGPGRGPTGATGTLSTVTDWSAATTYQPGQVVFCTLCTTNGSSYIALSTNSATDPSTHATYWGLIAQAGATGPAGAQGPQGPAGPTGPTGPAGNNGTGSVTSVTVGTVSNTAAAGAGTLTISNTTTTPTLSINFPAGAGTNSFSTIWTAVNPGSEAGTLFFMNPAGPNGISTTHNDSIASSTETNFMTAPATCTMRALNVGVNNYYDAAADTTTITVYHNLIATTMTCSASTTSGSSASCSDTNHTFSVSAGDSISIAFSETNAVPYNNVTAQLVCQ